MVRLNKDLAVGVFAVLFTVLLIGNVFSISDYESVSYRNHTDVIVEYPDNMTWDNASTQNIMVNADGYLMADQNDYARWESKALRINDKRKVVYEADVGNPGSIGLTIQVSDNESFETVKDIQTESLEDGFNEIELNMDRGSYTKLIIEFDKNAEATDAVNSLNVQGIRSNVKTGFSDVLSLAVFLLLFWFGIKVLGTVLGWWD